MLHGLAMFSGCFLVPLSLTSFFVASRRRQAFQWRDELLDLQQETYTQHTDMECRRYFRKVSPYTAVGDLSTDGETKHIVPLSKYDNIGLLCKPLLTEDEADTLLHEMKVWGDLYGQPVEPQRRKHFESLLERSLVEGKQLMESVVDTASSSAIAAARGIYDRIALKLKTEGFADVVLVSDHAVDSQLMKAPWHCGDSLDFSKMPSALRHIVDRVQTMYPDLGRLRHVYMEYTARGVACRPPQCPKAFDGHDYVVIPLREAHQTPTVVTMTPFMRSRSSLPSEVVVNSWTSRDIDSLVPRGHMLRVFGPARYFWAWSIRPVQWFGTCADTAAMSAPCNQRSLWSRTVSLFSRGHSAESAASSSPCSAQSAEGVLVLHFEGPRAKGKQRTKFLLPESIVFGVPPQPQTFDRWVETRPSRDDVLDEYIVLWMLNHVRDLLAAGW